MDKLCFFLNLQAFVIVTNLGSTEMQLATKNNIEEYHQNDLVLHCTAKRQWFPLLNIVGCNHTPGYQSRVKNYDTV